MAQGGTRVVSWTVFGGGHTWPGSPAAPGPADLSTQEFDAAEEICRFAEPVLASADSRRALTHVGHGRTCTATPEPLESRAAVAGRRKSTGPRLPAGVAAWPLERDNLAPVEYLPAPDTERLGAFDRAHQARPA